MQSPGSVVGAVRAGCSPGSVSWGMLGSHAVAWLGGPGSSGPIRLPGVVDGAVPAREGAPDLPVGSGGAGMASVGSVVGWGGGQPAIRLAGQPPAALMDRAVVGPAHQGQIGQVGGAAMEPVPQMVGVAPGQGPFTVGEDTAPSRTARAARWAGWTTRVVRPTSSGWVGAPPRIRGSRAVAAWSRAASRSVPLRWWAWGGGWALGSEAAGGGSSPWTSLGAGLVGP